MWKKKCKKLIDKECEQYLRNPLTFCDTKTNMRLWALYVFMFGVKKMQKRWKG